jgi:hypothetical protein
MRWVVECRVVLLISLNSKSNEPKAYAGRRLSAHATMRIRSNGAPRKPALNKPLQHALEMRGFEIMWVGLLLWLDEK